MCKITDLPSPRPWRNKEEISYGGNGCCKKTFHVSYHKKDGKVLIKQNNCCNNIKDVHYIEKQKIVLNGLKACTNIECSGVIYNKNKTLFVNRDKNAAMNMYKIFWFRKEGMTLERYNRKTEIEKDPAKVIHIKRMAHKFETNMSIQAT